MHIDVHTHAFHPKIAHKAVAHLNDFYDVQCAGNGTVEHLLERERAAGMDTCVVLCAATSPAQVIPANNHAIRLNREYDAVMAFGSIHPGFADWEAELARLKRAGLRGIKLHPDFQGFCLDDARLLPIFEAAQEDFIFLFHVGDDITPRENPSCPYKLARLMDMFPRMRVIAAHLGGYRMWEHALIALGQHQHKNLWLDTSSVTPFVHAEELRYLLRAFPADRLLFGSDWPLYDPLEELERLRDMAGLSEAELERLLCNASTLLD